MWTPSQTTAVSKPRSHVESTNILLPNRAELLFESPRMLGEAKELNMLSKRVKCMPMSATLSHAFNT